jgi:1-acyl-sn-glycerol-3-phosphate acyltransferase
VTEEATDGSSVGGARRFDSARIDPAYAETLSAHNERIGTRGQVLVQRALILLVLGPFAWLLLRVLFSVRAVGRHHLGAVERHGIFAVQHYFEWDPFVPFYAAVYGCSLRRPQLVALSLASSFWVRTRVARMMSWFLGVMGISRGLGPSQSGMERAARLLASERPTVITMYPTGPIGRQKEAEIRPGVGHLTLRCPDVPILPVTVTGLQQTHLRDVLLLRRPPLTVVIGTPFRAREVEGETYDARVEAVCRRIAHAWREGEAIGR